MFFFDMADCVGIVSQRMPRMLKPHPCFVVVSVLLHGGLREECRTNCQNEDTKDPWPEDLSKKMQLVPPLRFDLNATAHGRDKAR